MQQHLLKTRQVNPLDAPAYSQARQADQAKTACPRGYECYTGSEGRKGSEVAEVIKGYKGYNSLCASRKVIKVITIDKRHERL